MTTKWAVWRGGMWWPDKKPWCAEPTDAYNRRTWHSTWREAYDFARKAVNEEARG